MAVTTVKVKVSSQSSHQSLTDTFHLQHLPGLVRNNSHSHLLIGLGYNLCTPRSDHTIVHGIPNVENILSLEIQLTVLQFIIVKMNPARATQFWFNILFSSSPEMSLGLGATWGVQAGTCHTELRQLSGKPLYLPFLYQQIGREGLRC